MFQTVLPNSLPLNIHLTPFCPHLQAISFTIHIAARQLRHRLMTSEHKHTNTISRRAARIVIIYPLLTHEPHRIRLQNRVTLLSQTLLRTYTRITRTRCKGTRFLKVDNIRQRQTSIENGAL